MSWVPLPLALLPSTPISAYGQNPPPKMQTGLSNLPGKQLEWAAYHLSVPHKALPCLPLPRPQHSYGQKHSLFHPHSSTARSGFAPLHLSASCSFRPVCPPCFPATWQASTHPSTHFGSFSVDVPSLMPQNEIIPAFSFPIVHSMCFYYCTFHILL